MKRVAPAVKKKPPERRAHGGRQQHEGENEHEARVKKTRCRWRKGKTEASKGEAGRSAPRGIFRGERHPQKGRRKDDPERKKKGTRSSMKIDAAKKKGTRRERKGKEKKTEAGRKKEKCAVSQKLLKGGRVIFIPKKASSRPKKRLQRKPRRGERKTSPTPKRKTACRKSRLITLSWRRPRKKKD